jgi:hypothetical protein
MSRVGGDTDEEAKFFTPGHQQYHDKFRFGGALVIEAPIEA